MPKTVEQLPQRPVLVKPKRVAAYARVSSGKDAMLHSLSAQVSAYSQMIQQHPGWQYIGVYADEAVTGTKENRADFQRLLADCRAGRIDLVITKSISRFARNTVTLLETIRELRTLGVDVFFEEENLHSMSGEGELMLTILASYAQAESLSASENQKWRIRKSFQNGELMNWRFMFGYTITKDGVVINEAEAVIVREIMRRILAGESLSSIAQNLNKRKVLPRLGGKWNSISIRALVTNEKLTGNALLQKRFVNNHLEKKFKHNTGELPKYFVENSHPAIVDETTFRQVQTILVQMEKKSKGWAKPKQSLLTGKIICGKCGNTFKRVTSNGTPGWNCRTYQEKGVTFCKAKKIPEDTLKAVCADVMGTEAFNDDEFDNQIDHIEVLADNRLVFIFKDGHQAERTWTHRSRRESWTEEMKQKAREQTNARLRRNVCQP